MTINKINGTEYAGVVVKQIIKNTLKYENDYAAESKFFYQDLNHHRYTHLPEQHSV